MKLRNALAAVVAAVVASATVVTASATTYFGGTNADKSGMLACILSDDPNVPLYTDYAPISDLCGFSVTIKAADKKEVESAVNSGAWIGGAFIFNSNSTGWNQHSWAIEGTGDADGIFKPTEKRGVYVLEYMQSSPIFASTDTYAQLCFHNYADAYAFDVVSYTLLNSKGEDINKAPEETTAPAEETTAPTEETAAPTDETTVEVTIDTNEVETVEVDTEEIVDTDETAYTEDSSEVTDDTADTAVTGEYTDDTADVTDEAGITGESDDASAETAETTNDAANADDTKNNPETGVAGVAVAAGVVALAGAAVVASRKRK